MDFKTLLAWLGASILSGLVGGGAVLAIIWLTGTWFKARIENAIRHEYDRNIKELETQIKRREKGAVIAEFMAEWDSKPDDRKRMNQLAMEFSLWLPANLVREFTATTCYKNGAKAPKELLLLVRQYLAGGVDDGLAAEDIVYFPAQKKSSDS
jgi:hypothetical protein